MHMAGLEQLAHSMNMLSVDIQQFLFTNGAASFDCLFSMRGDYELSMTSRGKDPKFFLFQVSSDFQMSTYLQDTFQDLMSVLKTHGISTREFSTTRFFQALDEAVPHQARAAAVPTEPQIVSLRHDLEERERPFFDTWIYWTEKGPSEPNLKKTRAVLGSLAMEFSLKNRASSKWSAVDLGRTWTPA